MATWAKVRSQAAVIHSRSTSKKENARFRAALPITVEFENVEPSFHQQSLLALPFDKSTTTDLTPKPPKLAQKTFTKQPCLTTLTINQTKITHFTHA